MTRVAVVALFVLGAACARRTTESSGAPVDRGLLDLAPADTLMLTGIRVEAVRKTPLYQKHSGGAIGEALDSLTAANGLDPRKDLQEVLLASNGQTTVVLARGRFAGWKPSNPDIRVLDGRTAVVGKGVGGRQTISANLRRSLSEVAPGAHVWAVGLGGVVPGMVPTSGNLGNLERVFGSLAEWRISIDLAHGLNMDAAGTASSEEDAKKLSGAVRFLVASGRLSTPDNRPEMLRFYDAFQIKQEGARFTIQANIAQELIDGIIASPPGSLRRD